MDGIDIDKKALLSQEYHTPVGAYVFNHGLFEIHHGIGIHIPFNWQLLIRPFINRLAIIEAFGAVPAERRRILLGIGE